MLLHCRHFARIFARFCSRDPKCLHSNSNSMKRFAPFLLLLMILRFASHGQSHNELPINFLQGTDTLTIEKSLPDHDAVLMVWSQSAIPTSVEVMLGDANVMVMHRVETIRPGQNSLAIDVRNFCRADSAGPRKGRLLIVANKIKTPKNTVPFKSWTFPCPIAKR
jgi:hypothetical protein